MLFFPLAHVVYQLWWPRLTKNMHTQNSALCCGGDKTEIKQNNILVQTKDCQFAKNRFEASRAPLTLVSPLLMICCATGACLRMGARINMETQHRATSQHSKTSPEITNVNHLFWEMTQLYILLCNNVDLSVEKKIYYF